MSFQATLTPASVVRGDGLHGRHSRMDACLVEIDGSPAQKRTAMAFGTANAKVARRLVAGRRLTVKCEWRGGTLVVLGWPDKGKTS